MVLYSKCSELKLVHLRAAGATIRELKLVFLTTLSNTLETDIPPTDARRFARGLFAQVLARMNVPDVMRTLCPLVF